MKKTAKKVIVSVICLLIAFILSSCSGYLIPNQSGEQGEQGIQGIQGEKGEKGDKGDKGDDGLPGEQGVAGNNGEDGADGRTAEYRAYDGWVQWKYTDEADTEWRNLYEYYLTVTDPSDPIPDGVPSAYVTTEAMNDNMGLAGSFTKLTQKEIVVGDTVTLTATVNSGYNFEGWYIKNGYKYELLSTDLVYEYTVTSYDVTLVAQYSVYTISTYSNTDDSGLAGTYTMLNNQKKADGSSVELVATVNDGYNFDGWYINGTRVSADLTYTYDMGKESVSIEARYSAYTMTTVTEGNVANVAGSYTKLNSKKIAVGEDVTLTATVNDGYNFEGWFVDGVCVSRGLTYTYTMERENVTVCAKYSSYTVNTIAKEQDAYGKIQEGFAAGNYTSYVNKKVSCGQEVTLTATVNDGYNFVGWFVNGTCVSTELEYKFTMDKEDVTVTAMYSYYCLTTRAMDTSDRYSRYDFENASLYIDKVYTDEKICVGQTVTVTAYDIQEYKFIGWYSGNSVLLCTDKTFTFEMPNDNMTLKAWYVKN